MSSYLSAPVCKLSPDDVSAKAYDSRRFGFMPQKRMLHLESFFSDDYTLMHFSSIAFALITFALTALLWRLYFGGFTLAALLWRLLFRGTFCGFLRYWLKKTAAGYVSFNRYTPGMRSSQTKGIFASSVCGVLPFYPLTAPADTPPTMFLDSIR